MHEISLKSGINFQAVNIVRKAAVFLFTLLTKGAGSPEKEPKFATKKED
jgi:hypothetical protein